MFAFEAQEFRGGHLRWRMGHQFPLIKVLQPSQLCDSVCAVMNCFVLWFSIY